MRLINLSLMNQIGKLFTALAFLYSLALGCVCADTVSYFRDGPFGDVGDLLDSVGIGRNNRDSESLRSTFYVPGNSGRTKLTFRMERDTGGFSFDFGMYFVSNIRTLPTNIQNFPEEAISAATHIFDDRENSSGDTFTVYLPAGTEIGFFILPNNSIEEFLANPLDFYGDPRDNVYRSPLFSSPDANPGGFDQMLSFVGKGKTLFCFEDLTRKGGSDEDFTDLAFSIGVELDVDDNNAASVSIFGASIAEGSRGQQQLMFPVSLTKPLSRPGSVQFRTVPVSAKADRDFIPVSGTINIPADTSAVSISVPIFGDVLYEHDETFQLILSDPVGVELGEATALGKIINDDPKPTLIVPDASTLEGDSTTALVFYPTLDAESQYPIKILFRTRSGNALAGEDFIHTSNTFTFAPGSKVLSDNPRVSVVGDCLLESDEQFTLELSIDSSSEAILQTKLPNGHIINDDALPYVSFQDSVTVIEGNSDLVTVLLPLTMSQKCDIPIEVFYTIEAGSAFYEEDYTGSVQGSFLLSTDSEVVLLENVIVGDQLVEPDETLFVKLFINPSTASLLTPQIAVHILNDDVEPPKLPPTVRFDAPVPFQFFNTGEIDNPLSRAFADIQVTINAQDPDGGIISRVDLYLNNELAATLSPDEAYGISFSTVLEEISSGIHLLEAFAFDDEGDQNAPTKVKFEVGNPQGEVAIVNNGDSKDILPLQSSLFEMKISPRIFTQEELTLDALTDYEAVVWYDAGQFGLTDNTATVLYQAYAGGMPVYVVGELLREAGLLLTEPAQSMWFELAGLDVSTTCFAFEGVLNFDRHQDIPSPLNNTYGYVSDLSIQKPRCFTTFNLELDPYVYAGDTPVFGIFPSVNSTQRDLVRRASQQFLIADGDSPYGMFQSRAIFMNTICWLLNSCPNCFQGYLSVTESRSSDVLSGMHVRNIAQVGEWQTMDLLFANNGECDLYGLLVEMTFPKSFVIQLSSVFSQQMDWQLIDNNLIWRAGQLGRGTINGANCRVAFKAREPGLYQIEIHSKSNFASSNREVVHMEVEGDPTSTVPWKIAMAPSPGHRLDFLVSGAPNTLFRIESITNLHPNQLALWSIVPDVSGVTDEDGECTISLSVQDSAFMFYRVRTN